MIQLNITLKFNRPNDLQRQSNQSSSGGSGGGYSKSTSATSPYQSQLYDSWKTEWDGAYYDQRDHFRLDEGSSKTKEEDPFGPPKLEACPLVYRVTHPAD